MTPTLPRPVPHFILIMIPISNSLPILSEIYTKCKETMDKIE